MTMHQRSRRWALKTGALGLAAATAGLISGCGARSTLGSAGSSDLVPGEVAPGEVAPVAASGTATPSASIVAEPSASHPTEYPSRAQIIKKFKNDPAGQFGLEIKGITLGLPKGSTGTALTFDACGGAHGSGVDQALLKTLRTKKVPATLFVNQRWARSNAKLLTELAADPLFEIANHGTLHAPLTVGGQAAYGIAGTSSIGQAYDEVMDNQRYLADEFGITAKFFRSGTAHMDTVGAALCREVGLVPMNFTVNLDAGATFAAQTVAASVRQLGAGDVGIGHFNQPTSGTAKGIKLGLGPALEAGTRFVRLSDAW